MNLDITNERLKEVVNYCPDSGVFTRTISAPRVKAGSIVGSMNNGYLRIRVDGVRYLAHRLAWLYMNGEFPDGEVDHINHLRNDNRICNLRDVTRQENSRNMVIPKNNTSGCIGVIWRKNRKRWTAEIKVSGKSIKIGMYKNIADAVFARKAAEVKYGFHKNHNEARA